MEIHSLYSWDIFIQGFFLLICLSLGLFIVFKDNLEPFKDVRNIEKFSKRLNEIFFNLINFRNINPSEEGKVKGKGYKYLGFIPVIIIFSFIIGIVGQGIADEWIDSNNVNHLYLKSTWSRDILKYDKNKKILSDKKDSIIMNSLIHKSIMKNAIRDSIKDKSSLMLNELDYLKYKDIVREISFYRVFGKDTSLTSKVTPRYISQLYYHSKHDIIEKGKFQNYIRKNQAMAEYSRVFALGFFFLMSCGFLNLLIMVFRILFDDFKEANGNNKADIDVSLKIEGIEEKIKIEDDGEEGFLKRVKKGYIIVKKALGINIPNSVIMIMLAFSLIIIEVFINPFFNYYLENEIFESLFRLAVIGVLTYLGIFIFILLPLSKSFRRMKFSFFIYTIIYVFSYAGYFVSSKSWLLSEKKVASKTFGVLKSTHLTNKIEEIEFAEKYLNIKLFTTTKDKNKQAKDSLKKEK